MQHPYLQACLRAVGHGCGVAVLGLLALGMSQAQPVGAVHQLAVGENPKLMDTLKTMDLAGGKGLS